MKVILLAEIKGVGHRGMVKNVSDGYARNYLLPRELAAPATPSLVQKISRTQQEAATSVAVGDQKVMAALQGLQSNRLAFTENANEDGTLFSGISKKRIAEKIKEITGHELNEELVMLERPIKHLGIHLVSIAYKGQDYPLSIEVKV